MPALFFPALVCDTTMSDVDGPHVKKNANSPDDIVSGKFLWFMWGETRPEGTGIEEFSVRKKFHELENTAMESSNNIDTLGRAEL